MERNVDITMELNVEEFLQMLNNYYSKKLNKEVKFTENHSVKHQSYGYGIYDEYTEAVVDLKVSFVEESLVNGIKTKITTVLDQSDIEEAIRDFVSNTEYEFVSYKYLGGFRMAGYFRDEYEEAYFEGIKVNLKEKGMKRKLSI